MQNWKKDRNYRKFKNADGSFTYVIVVDGEPVKVNADVYREYARSARQLEYIEHDLKRDRILQNADGRVVFDAEGRPTILPEREVSLDKLLDEDWDYAADTPQPEDDVLCRMEIVELRCRLGMLTDSERALIKALFFDGKTERQYEAETGIPQKTINNRRRGILAKLKKLLGN